MTVHGVTSRGAAVLMQAKWIKLDLSCSGKNKPAVLTFADNYKILYIP